MVIQNRKELRTVLSLADQSEPSFLKCGKIEKYVEDGLSRVNNTFHRNVILEKLVLNFSSKTRKIIFDKKI